MSSSKDHFYHELQHSLRVSYASENMENFITDLMSAIRNIDEDPDLGFVFSQDENEWSSWEYVASEKYDDDELQMRWNKSGDAFAWNDLIFPENVVTATTTTQSQTTNVSIDTLSVHTFDYETCIETKASENDDHYKSQPEPKNEVTSTRRIESDNVSVDMFSQNDTAEMDEDNLNGNEESADLQREEMNKPSEDGTGESNLNAVEEPVVALQISNCEIPLITGVDCTISNHMRSQINSNVQSTNETIERYLDNDQEHNRNSEIVLRVPDELMDHDKCAEETTPKSSEMVQLNHLVKYSRKSESESSFRGFHAGAPLRTGSASHNAIDVSRQCGSDANTTVCDEYDTLFGPNFMPLDRTGSESVFLGFDPSALIRNRPEYEVPFGYNTVSTATKNHETLPDTPIIPLYVLPTTKSIGNRNSVRSSARSEINTTFCEEFETARTLAADLNETRNSRWNFDDAYSQFVESQSNSRPNDDRRQSFIDEIEKLTLKLQNDLVCGRQLVIEVPYTVSWSNCVVQNERLFLNPLSDGRCRNITTKRRVAMVFHILSFVYKLLVNRETCTKREIYYSDPEFAQNQLQVDKAVLDVCYILNANPWEFGVLSSSKGLIAGRIKLTQHDDTVLDVESFNGGILLPQHTVSIKKVETDAQFVLLVEKHTVYEKLLSDNFLKRIDKCILVTGRGYPDINTRVILKKIWDHCKCPIYALVDADPYGIEIMLSYRHGTKAMSFCNDDLAIPSVRWIGVYPSEIRKFNLLSLPLTKEDVNRLENLVKRPYLTTTIYEELLVLQKNLKKSEVEGLISTQIDDWIDSYLLSKIESGDGI